MANFFGVALAAGAVNLMPVRRSANKKRTACTSTEDVEHCSRLNAQQINQLGLEYDVWRAAHYGINPQVAQSEERVKSFVLYLARGGYYHQLALTRGVSKCTLMIHVKDVAKFMTATASDYIKLPSNAELPRLSIQLQDPANQQVLDRYKVVLYIDGFIVRIQRPDHAGDAYFCGRHGKSCDSLNVQYITDQHGEVRHIITGLSGSTHDKTAASWSAELITFLNNLPANYVMLGDPAYKGLHPKVMTTFTGQNLTPDQKSFNDACTRIRQIVERSIGASQLKWRMQQLKENRLPAKIGVMFAAECTVAAAVLHNRFTNFL